jgi:hypothetical protein
MEKKYLVIHRYEDEPSCNFYTKSELTEAINDADWFGPDYKFIDKFPSDLMIFPARSIFIMEGNVVIPKAKKVVTKFEL